MESISRYPSRLKDFPCERCSNAGCILCKCSERTESTGRYTRRLGEHFTGFWAAATADASSKSRQMHIDDIHAYMANGRNDHPFCGRFHVTGVDAGLQYTWRARPVTGGHFAVLAREGADLLE